MKPTLTLAALLLSAAAAAATGWAQTAETGADDDDDAEEAAAPAGAGVGGRTLTLGFAGLMDNSNRTDLEPINLSAGVLNSAGEYTLMSGGYYRMDVNSDGTQEISIEGPAFFRNVWINEIVINDIEVRPLGVDSLEFDAAGTATISFIAIRPGRYVVRIPGTTGETQQAIFTIQ
jgi:hypothetical protein